MKTVWVVVVIEESNGASVNGFGTLNTGFDVVVAFFVVDFVVERDVALSESENGFGAFEAVLNIQLVFVFIR